MQQHLRCRNSERLAAEIWRTGGEILHQNGKYYGREVGRIEPCHTLEQKRREIFQLVAGAVERIRDDESGNDKKYFDPQIAITTNTGDQSIFWHPAICRKK